jgi:predicted PurR-regulated permease PerM
VLVALFATDLWPTTVLVAAFFVVYQQLENYFIAPRILRGTVDLSAAAVLLAGLIGATALGLVGALMAIPVAAAVKVLLSEQLQARDEAEARAEASEVSRAALGGAEEAGGPTEEQGAGDSRGEGRRGATVPRA